MEVEDILTLIICFIGSLVIVFFLIPKIVGVARYNHLVDSPNRRSSHSTQTPRLGGVAFFLVFILGLYLLRGYNQSDITIAIVSGMLILFIIGLKDDLVVIRPITKLIAQVVASSFIFLNSNLHIHTLFNCLGIGELNIFVSIAIVAFFMLYLINAFNLIDGIDGLAATLSIISFTVFGVIFFMLNQYFYLGICLLGIGSLIPFLKYNLSQGKNKIFMGDAGSMLLGFTIALLTVRILSYDAELLEHLPIKIRNIPLFVIAVLFVPLFDTGRIFIVRVVKGRNPFSPDRQHIHHILIDYFGFSHKKVSFYIGIASSLLIILFFILGMNYGNAVFVTVLLLLIAALLFIFNRINPVNERLRKRRSLEN